MLNCISQQMVLYSVHNSQRCEENINVGKYIIFISLNIQYFIFIDFSDNNEVLTRRESEGSLNSATSLDLSSSFSGKSEVLNLQCVYCAQMSFNKYNFQEKQKHTIQLSLIPIIHLYKSTSKKDLQVNRGNCHWQSCSAM